jgi:hypothetical protein
MTARLGLRRRQVGREGRKTEFVVAMESPSAGDGKANENRSLNDGRSGLEDGDDNRGCKQCRVVGVS